MELRPAVVAGASRGVYLSSGELLAESLPAGAAKLLDKIERDDG